MARTAAVVTVGSELVEGLRLDTNSQEIALALSTAGLHVVESSSVGDERLTLAEVLTRLCAEHALVVVTGGLGPTHDDITRDAAAAALGLALLPDPALVESLRPAMARHTDPAAAEQVLVQALVLEGADVLPAVTGTAPGQIAPTPAGWLVLLPGPPREMRPMLAQVVERFGESRAAHRELSCTGMGESDVQVRVQRAIAGIDGINFTVLAKPGDVHAIFTDQGGGAEALERAAAASAEALGEACYSTSGETLAEVVIREATARGITIATAESCTGGMVAAALTDIAGASAVFLGGVVAYADAVKRDALDVSGATLDAHGAVSAETVAEMARGARSRLSADLAVSISGIAGPDGGTPDKPVGTVWFGIESADATSVQVTKQLGDNRVSVRLRATAAALDLVRRALLGMPLGGRS